MDSKGTWHFTNVPTSSRYEPFRGTGTVKTKGITAKKQTIKITGRKSKRQKLSPKELSHMIHKTARAYNLDPELVKAVIKVESDGVINAVSPKGAIGLMQLMPGTARELGVRNPYNPKENIEGGSKYLRQMIEQFNGDILLALAAYNAGPDAVRKYKGLPPYRETIRYVEKILLEWFNNKQKH
jgi:soluble lytic murein transglycosylase-like protein